MIRVTLTSIMVNDQDKAREFYTKILGFAIRHDIPLGAANWLTVVSPADPAGVELLLEPTGMPAAVVFQKALYDGGVPLTQLTVDDLAQEHQRLLALGVVFKSPPTPMGPIVAAVIDDTCGNYIQLVQPQ